MNICLLGNNLTNLVLANILLKKKINVDIISQSQPTLLKNTLRTIAISNDNYKFLVENIKGIKNLGWPTTKIKIFSEKNKSHKLFEFKNKNQNNFYLLKYIDFFNIIKNRKNNCFFIFKSNHHPTNKKPHECGA